MKLFQRIKLSPQIGVDLVVVIFGVLIALWVSNLNEERRERSQEVAYLAGILVDLQTDRTELVSRRSTAIRGLDVADKLIELREASPSFAPADSLSEWFFRAAFVDNFQALDHTYKEILGAGGLSLISDESLRRAISDYYRTIESADFFTEYYKGEEIDYWDLLAERLNPYDFAGITGQDSTLTRFVPSRVLALLRTDAEITNAILMNRHWTALRLEITDRRIKSNFELIQLLELYLDDQ